MLTRHPSSELEFYESFFLFKFIYFNWRLITLQYCIGFESNSLFGASLVAQMVKCLPAVRENPGLIPGLGRCPGVGNGNTLQYSCLENSMD